MQAKNELVTSYRYLSREYVDNAEAEVENPISKWEVDPEI